MRLHPLPQPGDRFGRLVVTGPARRIDKHTRIPCVCDCGRRVSPEEHNLRHGRTKSCGCLGKETRQAVRHGYACNGRIASEHKIWRGGRGIRVCGRWEKFENFIADMGRRPSLRHTIDRLDNSRGYAPGNCRWATRREQARNTSRNRYLRFRGERLIITDWARRIGIPVERLIERLAAGWSVKRAITQPIDQRFSSRRPKKERST